jgi:hypothetical protein
MLEAVAVVRLIVPHQLEAAVAPEAAVLVVVAVLLRDQAEQLILAAVVVAEDFLRQVCNKVWQEVLV